MPVVLAASDLGLVTVAALPYLEMNSANKLFDFLAAGLPVVVNYGGWQAEVLRREQAGLAAEPERPESLVPHFAISAMTVTSSQQWGARRAVWPRSNSTENASPQNSRRSWQAWSPRQRSLQRADDRAHAEVDPMLQSGRLLAQRLALKAFRHLKSR